MKGVFDESRPVVSVQSTPSVRTAADARTRRRMRATGRDRLYATRSTHDGAGEERCARRARRNLICVARSSRAFVARVRIHRWRASDGGFARGLCD